MNICERILKLCEINLDFEQGLKDYIAERGYTLLFYSPEMIQDRGVSYVAIQDKNRANPEVGYWTGDRIKILLDSPKSEEEAISIAKQYCERGSHH